MGMEEASRIIVLIQLQPIFILVLSLLFRDDVITGQQYAGFALIFVAAVAVSIQRKEGDESSKGGWQLSSALVWMLAATFIWSVGAILSDIVFGGFPEATRNSFETLMVSIGWSSVGYALGGLILYLIFPPVRNAFNHAWRTVPIMRAMPVVAVEGLFIARQWFYFSAISLGPVALVNVVGSTQVLWGVLLGWGLTLLAPNIFKETITRNELLYKGAWAMVMFIGILLLGSVY